MKRSQQPRQMRWAKESSLSNADKAAASRARQKGITGDSSADKALLEQLQKLQAESSFEELLKRYS